MLDFNDDRPLVARVPVEPQRTQVKTTKTTVYGTPAKKTIKSLSPSDIAALVPAELSDLFSHEVDRFPGYDVCTFISNPTKENIGNPLPFQAKISVPGRAKWFGRATRHLLKENSELASAFRRLMRAEQRKVYTNDPNQKRMTCRISRSPHKDGKGGNIWTFDFKGNLYVKFLPNPEIRETEGPVMSYQAKDIYTVLTSRSNSVDPVIAAHPEIFSAETHATVWLNNTMVMVYPKDRDVLARKDYKFWAHYVAKLFIDECYFERSPETQAYIEACFKHIKENGIEAKEAFGDIPFIRGSSASTDRRKQPRFEPETAGESSTTPLVAPATKAAKRKPHKGKRNAGHPEE